jgi:hypothetical protein
MQGICMVGVSFALTEEVGEYDYCALNCKYNRNLC